MAKEGKGGEEGGRKMRERERDRGRKGEGSEPRITVQMYRVQAAPLSRSTKHKWGTTNKQPTHV